MLDHDSPVDLHEQLSNLLREQIKQELIASWVLAWNVSLGQHPVTG